MEREAEQFDLDGDFVANADEEDYDRFIDRPDRRKHQPDNRCLHLDAE